MTIRGCHSVPRLPQAAYAVASWSGVPRKLPCPIASWIWSKGPYGEILPVHRGCVWKYAASGRMPGLSARNWIPVGWPNPKLAWRSVRAVLLRSYTRTLSGIYVVLQLRAMVSTQGRYPPNDSRIQFWKVNPEKVQVPGHSIVVEVVTVPVCRAAPSVKGLNDEPAGYAPSTALSVICSWFGAASGMPPRVVPSVMALGSNAGSEARTQTSPLRGSTVALPTRG